MCEFSGAVFMYVRKRLGNVLVGNDPWSLPSVEPGLEPERVVEVPVGEHHGVQRRVGFFANQLVHRLGGLGGPGVDE